MNSKDVVVLYGDTIYRTDVGRAIQMIGRAHIGKTTSARRVEELSNGRYLLASSDDTVLRIPERTIISSKSDVNGKELTRLILYKGKGGWTNPNLSASLLYCMDMLDLKPNEFNRVEGDPEQTAIKLLALLEKITG